MQKGFFEIPKDQTVSNPVTDSTRRFVLERRATVETASGFTILFSSYESGIQYTLQTPNPYFHSRMASDYVDQLFSMN